MSTPLAHRSSTGSGLGISFASLSPPSVSTTQVSTGFTATPGASSSTIPSPSRPLPYPSDSPSRPMNARNAQNQYQPPLSLRPTHHRSTSSKGFTSFSALPPTPTRGPRQPTPNRPLPEKHPNGSISSRAESSSTDPGAGLERTQDSLKRNTSSASTATAGSKIRKSRSSDLLRRLSRGHETVSGGKYVPLSGDDGERDEYREEEATPRTPSRNRQRSDTVSTVSAHPAQSPQTHDPTPSDSQHSFLPSSFPAPPYRPASTSQSAPRPPAPVLARSTSQPQNLYSDESNDRYSPYDPKRISDPSTGIHSQNHALFAAEKGGKMLAYSADGIWSANSITSTPPTVTNSRQPPPALVSTSQEDLRMRPWSYTTESHPTTRPAHVRSLSEGATLARYGTLLHPSSGGQRASTELGIMLGNKSRRLSQGKLLPPPELDAWRATGGGTGEKVKLEAAKKRRARVEVDVVLERECVVEGGEVRGRLEVKVNGSKSEGLRVGGGKVRVVGYEDISPQSRHIFYHHPYPLPLFAHPPLPSGPSSSLFASPPDPDGFREINPGNHWIPFCMRLPLSGGAKGSYTSPHPKGPSVRYVVVGSVKLLHPRTGKRSIAHFYRPIVVLPYLNPGAVLAPCEEIVEVIERRGLGWSLGGAKGVVELRIALGRDVWVSGQRVWCEVGVRNESTKRIKSLTLALLQTVQTFLPDNDRAAVSTDKDGIPNADEALGIASTFRRKVAEESIIADEPDHGAGRVTGKRWWTGVEAGETGGWDLSLLIPNGMITIPRSRLIEVTYTLRLTANGSTNLFVDVPLTLINFLSIDPPPMPGDGTRYGLGQRQAVPIPLDEQGNYPVASTAVGPYGNMPRGGTSVRSGESASGPARASSTTLHIDALLSAGRARAEIEAQAHYPEIAKSRAPRPLSMVSDYTTPDVFGQHHQIGTPLGWPNRSPLPAVNESSRPTRPKAGRVMSYLSTRSSAFEHENPLSETDAEEEDDEADRALLAAARREGRKMSLAALTRAAEREKEDYDQEPDLLSPTRETPPTGMWLPAETPYEEVFKVLGETPSMHSRSEKDGVGSPAPVPTVNSGRMGNRAKDELDEVERLERLTIAEEQEALASTRGSSDDHHSNEHGSSEDPQMGYSDRDLRPADGDLEPPSVFSKGEYGGIPGRRSHESIPEEDEPVGEDETELDVGNETVLEDLVALQKDDTPRRAEYQDQGAYVEDHRGSPGQTENMFEYNDQIGKSPDPASIDSLNSGTGHTASSLRVPSRRGSALDPMTLRTVDSERETYIQQTRSIYGSFAASAISEQESEVGQVVEAVKRNLSIKTPSKTMKYRFDQDMEEEMDADRLSPARALNIPRSGSAPMGMVPKPRKASHTPSPEKRAEGGLSPKSIVGRFGSTPNMQGYTMKRETSAPSAPSPLRDQTTIPSIGRVFANRPSFSFNAPAPLREGREASLSPRGGTTYQLSPGPSPRSAFPSSSLPEPLNMARGLSAQSSQLRNQVRIRPPSEELNEDGVPQLAPSVASDSASSDGHALESPPVASHPVNIEAVILNDSQAHTSLPSGSDMTKIAAPKKDFAPVLDPNWIPGDHLLHTQVAYARTSFSAPDSQTHRASQDRRPSKAGLSPHGTRSRKASRSGGMEKDTYPADDESLASHTYHLSRPGSPSASSHSSHAPMLSGMHSRLRQLELRDEALRKFSVASAVSAGGSAAGYERDRVGSIPRQPSNAGMEARRESNQGSGQKTEKEVKKRRSYTAALGSRPTRSISDDIIDKPSSGVNGNLGGTTYITRRPYGASPPAIDSHQAGPGFYSPPRLELSFSPPTRPVSEIQRHMSTSSVSTTATNIEAALRRPGGPRPTQTRIPPTTTRMPRAPADIDPYETLHSSPQGSGGHIYQAQRHVGPDRSEAYRSETGPLVRSRSDFLMPDHAYGPDTYGSEAGSVTSRNGLDQEWAEPVRSWIPRGSVATDESEGLL